MTWSMVATYVRSKCCDRCRTVASCRGCKRAEHIAEQCEALAVGQAGDFDAVVAWIASRRCSNATCTHAGCHKQDNILQWLQIRVAA